MTAAIVLSLCALALFSLVSRDLVQGVIALSALSLLSSIVFYIMHAPDVAITEAAVGAGVSTVVYAWVIRMTGRKDET